MSAERAVIDRIMSPASTAERLGVPLPAPRRLSGAMTKLNILVTGTSRGIGKAILAALGGHRVVGHSTAGGGGRIAADLSQPGAAEAPVERGARTARRADRRARQQCRHLRGRRRSTPARPWVAHWERTHAGQPAPPRPSFAGSPCSISASAAAAGGSSTSPAAPPIAAIQPRPLALCRVEGAAWSAMTKSIARGYAGESIFAFTVCPGFTVLRHGRGVYRQPRRQSLLADMPLGRIADRRRGRRDGALACGRRAAPRRPAR